MRACIKLNSNEMGRDSSSNHMQGAKGHHAMTGLLPQGDPRKDQKAKAGRNLSLVNSEAVQARSTKTKGGEESDRPQGPPFPLQILESRKQNTKTIFQTGGQEKEIGKGENNNFQSTQVVATPEAEVKGNPGC